MFCSVTPMPAALSERLETTVAASARPGTPIFLPLRSAMLLMSLSPGYEQLGAAGVQAGGELDGQAVFERLEQLADQAHADIDLIRADGLGNVRRIDRYLFDIEVFLLESSRFRSRYTSAPRTARRGVDQAEMGGRRCRRKLPSAEASDECGTCCCRRR